MNVSARAGMALALLAAAPATTILILQCVLGNTWVFNDFHAYWLAARLVARGQSPYDFAAFTDLARSSGIPSVVGMGYSYPPFFAVVMVPLASLPFDIAARVFAGGSALVLGVTIAGLLRAAPALASTTWRRTAASALAMGLYPPIISSLVMGQVNLFVLALVAFGMLGGHSLPRMIAAGVALGVAAGVKMVPIVLLFPLLLARRSVIALSMLGAIVATVVFSSLAAPEAMRGTESLGGLFDADPYWTNQSLNGFGSRLFLEGDRTHALAADNRVSISVVSPALVVVLALATGWVLWSARRGLGKQRVLEVALAFALVAATAGAPKTSFNNHAPALLGAWMLLARPAASGGGLQGIERWLMGSWILGALALAGIEPLNDPFEGVLGALRTLATSAALFGLLGLWLVLGRQLHRLARLSGSF